MTVRLLITSVVVLILIASTAGCSMQARKQCLVVYEPDPDKPISETRSFAQNALTFNIDASTYLNFYDNSKHALTLAIIQIRSPNRFQQLINSKFGIRYLLESSESEKDFISHQRFAVQPGSKDTIVIDRMEDAKFIGIVAGFYQGDKASRVRLIEIPMVTKPGFNIPVPLSWVWPKPKTELPEPAELVVSLNLTEDRISDLRSSIVNICSPSITPAIPTFLDL